MRALLSHDLPRSKLLAALLIVTVLGLALTPFIFPGTKALNVAAKILIFITLVASYDLLLGYTGIVSFAHTMFFGIGAYGVAIACARVEDPGWGTVALGVGCALGVSLLLSLLIGLFSLRVKAIFFAMITMAVAAAFLTLASQLSEFTGGEDGLSFKVPEALRPSTEYLEEPFLGAMIDGKFAAYYLLFFATIALLLLMLRIVNSPFGRVLQAIRENDFRAEAIGYRTVVYRTLSNVLAALFATCAGALLALWLRYNGPDTSLSLEIMLDILLIVVIGGMGTIYGAVLGSALFVLAQNYLQDLMKLGASAVEGIPVLSATDRAGPLAALDGCALRAGGLSLSLRRGGPPAPGRNCQGARAMSRQPHSRYLVCEGRELHYMEWGAEHQEVVIAWHGLARTGRDMDDLAEHLSSRYRVICPDTLGRGLSQWSPAPDDEYCLAFLCEPGHWPGEPAGHRALPLGGHFDGWRHRHGGSGHHAAWPHPPPAAQRQRPRDHRPGGAAHPQLCRQPAGLRHHGRAGAVLPHHLRTLWLAERRAVAPPDRDLDAPPARWPRDAALRPGHGAPVHHPAR